MDIDMLPEPGDERRAAASSGRRAALVSAG